MAAVTAVLLPTGAVGENPVPKLLAGGVAAAGEKS